MRVTHLSTAVVASSPAGADRQPSTASGPPASHPEQAADRLGAGTVDDHIGRYRQLAEAGVRDGDRGPARRCTPGALETFGRVIAGFEPDPPASAAVVSRRPSLGGDS